MHFHAELFGEAVKGESSKRLGQATCSLSIRLDIHELYVSGLDLLMQPQRAPFLRDYQIFWVP
jgi:hypothetical protein